MIEFDSDKRENELLLQRIFEWYERNPNSSKLYEACMKAMDLMTEIDEQWVNKIHYETFEDFMEGNYGR